MFFSRPRPAVPRALRSQAGAAVWYVLAGLGVVGVAAAFWLTSDQSRLPEVAQEVSNLKTLAHGLQHGYPERDYSLLTTHDAIGRELVPGPMFRGGGRTIRSAWGTSIDMAPHTVLKTADGFVVTYAGVPSLPCQQLGRALAGEVYELKVSGKTILAPDGFDPEKAEQHCTRTEGATMEFFFHPELVPQTGVLR